MPGPYTCEQVIQALQKTKGMVYLAARELGCHHQTIYNHIEKNPSVKRAWQAEHGKVGDSAELRLYQAIMNEEHWAITFYLRTKGKDRGYVERQEHATPGSDTLVFEFVKRKDDD